MTAVLSAILLVGLSVTGITHTKMRPQGSATVASHTWYHVCDSSDTFQVDTFYSDTVDLGSYENLVYRLRLTGYALADSANDSVLILVHGVGRNEASALFDSAIIIDTIPTTLGTLDSTEYIQGVLRLDSLPYTQLFFRTIVMDSFISGYDVGAFSDKDSSEFRLYYDVVQTKSTTAR